MAEAAMIACNIRTLTVKNLHSKMAIGTMICSTIPLLKREEFHYTIKGFDKALCGQQPKTLLRI
jgi:hypothetical protein